MTCTKHRSLATLKRRRPWCVSCQCWWTSQLWKWDYGRFIILYLLRRVTWLGIFHPVQRCRDIFFEWIPNFQKFSKLKRSKFQADIEGTFLSQFRKYLPTSIPADVKFRTRLTFNTEKYIQKLFKITEVWLNQMDLRKTVIQIFITKASFQFSWIFLWGSTKI